MQWKECLNNNDITNALAGVTDLNDLCELCEAV